MSCLRGDMPTLCRYRRAHAKHWQVQWGGLHGKNHSAEMFFCESALITTNRLRIQLWGGISGGPGGI